MPRKARIDAPGALHHIVIRGIERKPIFNDSQDYQNFIKRLGNILSESSTPCFAWVLMTNHSHYIHLNPIRAGMLKDLKALNYYSRSGHAVIMGRIKHDWYDTNYVPPRFGDSVIEAGKSYLSFVRKGIDPGRRPELVGGGLLRSIGGWSALKAMRD